MIEEADARVDAPILQVEAISLAFGGLNALRNVSLDVVPGCITALVGPNGAGKTSLFNAISGFYRPQSGRVFFEGRDITRLSAPPRAKIGLARTFQNIALFRGLTVLDNIKLGRHAHLRTSLVEALFCKSERQAPRETLIDRRVIPSTRCKAVNLHGPPPER